MAAGNISSKGINPDVYTELKQSQLRGEEKLDNGQKSGAVISQKNINKIRKASMVTTWEDAGKPETATLYGLHSRLKSIREAADLWGVGYNVGYDEDRNYVFSMNRSQAAEMWSRIDAADAGDASYIIVTGGDYDIDMSLVRDVFGDHAGYETLQVSKLIAKSSPGSIINVGGDNYADAKLYDNLLLSELLVTPSINENFEKWRNEGGWFRKTVSIPSQIILDSVTEIETAAHVGLTSVLSDTQWTTDIESDAQTTLVVEGIGLALGGATKLKHLDKADEFFEFADNIDPKKAQRILDNDKLVNSPVLDSSLNQAGVSKARFNAMLNKEYPLAFENADQYKQFQKELNDVMNSSGLGQARADITGSSTTFFSENPNKTLGHHFDADGLSDVDIMISGESVPTLMNKGGVKTAHPTQPNHFGEKRTHRVFPELDQFAARWESITGREFNFTALTDPNASSLSVNDFNAFNGRSR